MGISKRNKRKLIFRDQDFFWWVKEEFDWDGGMLEVNIATEDKAFLIRYYAIQNKTKDRHLTVIGKTFPGMKIKNGNWQKFICPDFITNFTNNGISPKNIISILEWCFDLEKTLIKVNNEAEK